MAKKTIKRVLKSTVKTTVSAGGNATKAVAVNRASDALVRVAVKAVAPSKVDSKIITQTVAGAIPILIGQLVPFIFKSDKGIQKAQQLCGVCFEHRLAKQLDSAVDGLSEPLKELISMFKEDNLDSDDSEADEKESTDDDA